VAAEKLTAGTVVWMPARQRLDAEGMFVFTQRGLCWPLPPPHAGARQAPRCTRMWAAPQGTACCPMDVGWELRRAPRPRLSWASPKKPHRRELSKAEVIAAPCTHPFCCQMICSPNPALLSLCSIPSPCCRDWGQERNHEQKQGRTHRRHRAYAPAMDSLSRTRKQPSRPALASSSSAITLLMFRWYQLAAAILVGGTMSATLRCVPHPTWADCQGR